MSFAEFLAEIPRLTSEQRRAALCRMREVEAVQTPAEAGQNFAARRVGGRLRLAAPRLIRQAEVDAILEEFP